MTEEEQQHLARAFEHLEQLLVASWEMRDSLVSMRRALAEILPGFEAAYQHHYEAVTSSRSLDSRPLAIEQLHRVVEELRKKK